MDGLELAERRSNHDALKRATQQLLNLMTSIIKLMTTLSNDVCCNDYGFVWLSSQKINTEMKMNVKLLYLSFRYSNNHRLLMQTLVLVLVRCSVTALYQKAEPSRGLCPTHWQKYTSHQQIQIKRHSDFTFWWHYENRCFLQLLCYTINVCYH